MCIRDRSKAIYDVCSKTMGGVGIALAMIGVVVCPITSGAVSYTHLDVYKRQVLAEAQTRAAALEQIVAYGREAAAKETDALVNRCV